MTEQYSKSPDKRENGNSDWVLKASISLLAVVAAAAVVWIVFFADNGAKDFFNSRPLADKPVEYTEEFVKTPDEELRKTIVPSFDVVRISRNGTGVIAGRAEPKSDIYVYAGDKVVGSAVADRNGEWVLLYEEPLSSGTTELSLKSLIPGEFEVFSSDVVIVSVPTREENRFIEDEKNGVIAIRTPQNGDGPTRVLQKPRLVDFSELSKGLTLDAMDFVGDAKVIISGTASKNSRIRIYLNNDFLAETTVTDAGFWTHTFERNISKSEPHTLRIDQILDGDDVEVRVEQPFERGLPIDPKAAKGRVIVQPGNNLWHIARKLYGSGIHYTLIFGANKDAIKDPDLIYPGQKFALPRDIEE